ncbi:cell surface A33 antigen-like [Takifugu flavidus]|uniref:cell surface A33 antigen-like n=1 Tax=Takifugu flavidus TaxID=433684 RepID=UPI0025446094|nr:cell surface A33 antigen-like [Takifugu flavidus]
MDWRFFIWTLLCLSRPGVEALNVDIPEDLYEFARGDNITLPCNFKPSIKPSLIIITWSAEAEAAGAEENLILTHYSSTAVTDISPPYEGRASLDVDVDQGKANLKLSSIKMEDNKVFECRVQIPRDDEGKPVDTAKLVVLVAPSVPICAIEGKAQYGQNINLTCKSEEGSPPPTYKWQGRDVRNMPRVPDPRTTDKDGILSLYNISKDTSGYYICTSSNKIRSAQCNITLAVMPPTMNLGSTGTIIGIVAGVIGLIAIIVIVYCCCRRKKKKQQDAEYAMGVREDEYHDKEEAKNGESRHPDGQEDPVDIRDRREERSERNYDDQRSDYDDRRSDYDDRRDRRRDYDDRRSDYDDRRSEYDDRRSDYDDRRSDYDDRRDRYDDSYNRRDDRGRRDHYDDRRYDEPYDDRESSRPRVPANKPPKKDYDD